MNRFYFSNLKSKSRKIIGVCRLVCKIAAISLGQISPAALIIIATKTFTSNTKKETIPTTWLWVNPFCAHTPNPTKWTRSSQIPVVFPLKLKVSNWRLPKVDCFNLREEIPRNTKCVLAPPCAIVSARGSLIRPLWIAWRMKRVIYDDAHRLRGTQAGGKVQSKLPSV